MMPNRWRALALALAGLSGCAPLIINRADRDVYSLIESRQRAALGTTANAHIGEESGSVERSESMYRFAPHPLDTETVAPAPATTPDATGDSADPATPVADPASDSSTANPALGLRDCLAYAMRHSREYQDAKEDLYLAALDLTLERHLWTPQFVASVQHDFADYGQVRDFDRAMTAVSNVAVSQRLPYGGNVTASVVNSLMRDLGVHTTSGESGNFILSAEIPLFRGAGNAAYESRFQAERDLVYAVRNFEQFRRDFLVRTASEYFDLQQSKAAITNAKLSLESRKNDYERAETINSLGQSKTVFDAPRAQSSLRNAEVSMVTAVEQYESALDQFKIFIGMPVNERLDVVDQGDDRESEALELLVPAYDEPFAVQLGLKYRLDLLNVLDGVDDARRGVLVAKNAVLPELNLSGSAALDTDPNQLNSISYNSERTTWRTMLTLETNDRKAERNAYRASLIALRKAERDHERLSDTVRADVRRALRRIDQNSELREIRKLSVEENELRADAARAQYNLGKTTNQDVVDADNDLLSARNELAAAVSRYRVSILEFRRDSGTLRVTDDGDWQSPDIPVAAPSDASR